MILISTNILINPFWDCLLRGACSFDAVVVLERCCGLCVEMLDAALIRVGCRGYPCIIWQCLCSGCFLSLQEEQKSPSVTTDSFVVGAVLCFP